MKTLIMAGFALALTTLAASAQHNQGMHGQMQQKMQQHHGQAQPPAKADPHGGHGPASATSAAPSTKAFEAANDRMHKDMAIQFSGNADIDFFKGMIPHHQGAIDMAKVVLEHGKDPETKKMAQEIIAAQEKEIAFMREWLKKNGQ